MNEGSLEFYLKSISINIIQKIKMYNLIYKNIKTIKIAIKKNLKGRNNINLNICN